MKDNPVLDVAVIGGGQAGLSTSYLLKKSNLNHIVFERGQIGDCWRSQRWDSFVLNSPNQFNLLPDEIPDYDHPEAFISGIQFADRLTRYANKYQLPVRENSKVSSVEKTNDGKYFSITVNQNGQTETWKSRQIVIASGGQTHPKIPSISKELPANITQLHSSEYRNPVQLPSGAVLVIGSATSGVQIAEDLIAANRKVYLATSAVARVPRRYRGRDVMAWMADMGFFDKPTAVAEQKEIEMEAPLMSGIGEFGHTISLQSLHKQGVVLLGYMDHVENNVFHFRNNLAENIAFGDMFSSQVKQGVDQFIAATGWPAGPPETDEADIPDESIMNTDPITRLDCSEKNITSIIWATGFTCDWSWVRLPVFNTHGLPIHSNGISPVNGVYVIGLPWLRNLKSSLIYGTADDAAEITKAIVQNSVF
jgi:putative flavoprotein involved in K+ transport